MSSKGAYGPLGYGPEDKYVIVDVVAPWCKVVNDQFNSIDEAREVLQENPCFHHVTIMEYNKWVDQWNRRFSCNEIPSDKDIREYL